MIVLLVGLFSLSSSRGRPFEIMNLRSGTVSGLLVTI